MARESGSGVAARDGLPPIQGQLRAISGPVSIEVPLTGRIVVSDPMIRQIPDM